MMEYSEEMVQKLNECYRLLKKRVYTKLELQRYFETGERSVRLMVSAIKKRAAVIAPSRSKGYRIATSAEDVPDALSQYAETLSRIADLAEGLPPLGDFIQKHGSCLSGVLYSRSMRTIRDIFRGEICRK